MALLFLSSFSQPALQGAASEGGEVDTGKAVFTGQDEGFGQLVAGDHLAFPLRPVQKFPGPAGGGGVVQVEDADDGAIPDSHVIADGKIHTHTTRK